MLRKVLFLLFVLIATVTAQEPDTTVKKPANKVTMFIQTLNGTDPVKKGFYYRNPQITCQLNHGRVSFSGKFDASPADTASHILDAYISYRLASQWKLQGGRLINWMRAIDPPSEMKIFILNPFSPFGKPTSDMGVGIQYGELKEKNFFTFYILNGSGGSVDNNTSMDVMFYFEQRPWSWVVTRGGFQTGKQPAPIGQKGKGFLQAFVTFRGTTLGGSLLQEKSHSLEYRGWLLEANHMFTKFVGADSLQFVSRLYNIGNDRVKDYHGMEAVVGCQYFIDILKFQLNYVWREEGKDDFLFLCQIYYSFKF
ncbi:hypothetical protein GYA54_04080 [Candidatus Kuenenbacteria bacterium]|nr:hypothetical protein [Candidatus Kuenenbacteria bacterium]